MTKTILIVDDNPEGMMLTKLALSMLDPNIQTQSASSGEEALEHLKKSESLPNLVLLDMKMPGMGGIETLRKIRSDEQLKDVPVVVTTLSVLDTDLKAARKAGATGIIRKEIRLKEFSKDLARHLKQALHPRTPGSPPCPR